MAIATIDNVKLKLWLETTTAFEDSQIQFYLDSTETLIDSMFWNFNLSNKTEVLNSCDVSDFIYVNNPNPISIISINWKAYTGIINTNYKIVWKKVIINDLWLYPNAHFNLLEIEYLAWYTPLPKDIIFFHTCLVEWELAKEWGKEIAKEKLWPREVVFVDTPLNRSIIEAIQSKYTIITI
jgi:hypothetical protein